MPHVLIPDLEMLAKTDQARPDIQTELVVTGSSSLLPNI